MWFPAGLCARLVQRRLLHGFSRENNSAIFHLSPLVKHFTARVATENLVPESEWHSAKACVRAAQEARAAVVWLGGTEPLFHPTIGEVSSALVDSGMYVFLHTSGVGLRKRIHEFNPVNRLYLTLEVPAHDAAGSQGRNPLSHGVPFATVLEGIRVARLSGLHVCAHFTIAETTSAADIAARIEAIQPQRLDGIAVSSGGARQIPLGHTIFAEALAAATQLIPSSGWRSFSRLLEASYEQVAQRAVPVLPVRAASANDGPTSSAETCEETA
jgi:hypothetical protein